MSKGKNFLSDLKFYTDYSKWNNVENRYENWEEACEAVIDTHRVKYKDNLKELTPYIEEALEAYKDKLILASQRNLQFRGEQIFKHNTRLFNCSVLYMDKIEAFSQASYLSLSGCGVGVSFLKKWLNKLPKLKERTGEIKNFIIPDSIEGWSDAFGILVSSFCEGNSHFPEYENCIVRFDYSEIRPKGALISGGFKAPGPEPLKQSMERIERLLENEVRNDNKPVKFRGVVAYDILMHIADAILSAGLRRSALSIIIDPTDEELLNAKTGNWRETNKQRERSNNSVGLRRGTFEYEYFLKLVKKNEGMSDLGFYFMNNDYEVPNPCYSLDTKILTDKGWRTFEELLDKTPNIVQDNRVKGYLEEGVEKWEFDYNKLGTSINKATKVCKTGINQEVYKLETNGGRVVKATKNHHFATKKGMIELQDLKISDEILIGVPDCHFTDKNSKQYIDGFISGLICGDGNVTNTGVNIDIWVKDNSKEYNVITFLENYIEDLLKEEEKKTHKNRKLKFNESIFEGYKKYRLNSSMLKNLLEKEYNFDKKSFEWIHKNSKDFKAGFLYGMFYSDGHVEFGEKNKSLSIRITSNSKEKLKDLQLILQELGVVSKIYNLLPEKYTNLPDGKGGYKEYKTKESFRLTLNNRNNIKNFGDLCFNGFSDKESKYYNLITEYPPTRKPKINFIDKVKSIEYVGKEDVYCLEENNNRTLISEGLTARRCFEINFTPILDVENEVTGVSLCNLSEINGKGLRKNDKFSEELFIKACRAASILGTLQAGYTDFKYLGSVTEEIVKKESLIGVSITGWMNSPELFDKELLAKGVAEIKKVNEEVSKIIGINPAARLTCTKPSGNASVLLGCESGIHGGHSRRYFRIMQLNKISETAKWLEENFPEIIEESVWSATNSDYVVYSPVELSDKTILKDHIKGVKHLEMIKFVQENWVMNGQVEDRCIMPKTMNNVSCTVIIDDYDDIAKYVYEHQNIFTGVSFLSQFGDKDYEQAPFTSVLNSQELLEKYGDAVIFASGLIVDGLHYFDNNLWQACNHVLDKNKKIEGTRTEVLLKKDWIRRAKQFSKNYFKNDLQNCIYCLKDVHLWYKWNKINKSFKDVNFEEILTKPTFNEVDKYAAVACSGGSCELI